MHFRHTIYARADTHIPHTTNPSNLHSHSHPHSHPSHPHSQSRSDSSLSHATPRSSLRPQQSRLCGGQRLPHIEASNNYQQLSTIDNFMVLFHRTLCTQSGSTHKTHSVPCSHCVMLVAVSIYSLCAEAVRVRRFTVPRASATLLRKLLCPGSVQLLCCCEKETT